jgi:voltage-gated potassium channel
MQGSPTNARNASYLLFTLILSVFAIVVLGLSVFVPMGSQPRRVLNYADDALCAFFFIDFLISMKNAPNRWAYFARWGWIDLLSCIPYGDYFRTGRVARIFRVFRVLRAIRSARMLATLILDRRAQSALLATSLSAFVLIILASIGILQFEDVAGANIVGAEDALWWTMETITTVGYGDRYPITTEGRVLASAVMVAGVGLTAMYTGALAAWFLRPPEQASEIARSGLAGPVATMDRNALLELQQEISRRLDVD